MSTRALLREQLRRVGHELELLAPTSPTMRAIILAELLFETEEAPAEVAPPPSTRTL
jgi:hypothetical protein